MRSARFRPPPSAGASAQPAGAGPTPFSPPPATTHQPRAAAPPPPPPPSVCSPPAALPPGARHARIEGVDEVLYDDLGHLSLLTDRRVAGEVIARLGR